MNSTQGEFGHQFADGVRAALKDYPVKVVERDDRDSPDLAKDIAASVVQDPRVILVIGHSASSTTISAAPTYADRELAMISPVATTDNLFPGRSAPGLPTVFRLPPRNKLQARAIVKYLLQSEAQQLVVVWRNDRAYSKSILDSIEAEWTHPNEFRSVELSTFQLTHDSEPDTITLASAIAAQFNAMTEPLGKKPERIIVVATYYRDAIYAVHAIRRAQALGQLDSRTRVLFTDGSMHPGLGLKLGQDLKGSEMVFVGPSWQEFDPDKTIFSTYQEIHEHGKPPHIQRPDQPKSWARMWPSFMEYGYLAGRVALRALEKSKQDGGITKARVLTSLREADFDVGLTCWPRFSFVQEKVPVAVMEPKQYIFTFYQVNRTEPEMELDSSWLSLTRQYTQLDVQ